MKTVGNPSENQTEQMMVGLRSLPPKELEKVTRELLAALVKGKDNVDKFKKGDEARPAE